MEGTPIPLGTYIAGAYTGTIASVALGIAQDGYDLTIDPKQTMINRSDVFGDMLIDAIYRGIDVAIQAEFMEYKAGPIAAVSPFSAIGTASGVIGRLASNIAAALVLTSTTGTPAVATPATITANLCLLAPNFQPKLLYNSLLRTVPIRWTVYPYDSGGGVLKHFVQT